MNFGCRRGSDSKGPLSDSSWPARSASDLVKPLHFSSHISSGSILEKLIELQDARDARSALRSVVHQCVRWTIFTASPIFSARFNPRSLCRRSRCICWWSGDVRSTCYADWCLSIDASSQSRVSASIDFYLARQTELTDQTPFNFTSSFAMHLHFAAGYREDDGRAIFIFGTGLCVFLA